MYGDWLVLLGEVCFDLIVFNLLYIEVDDLYLE